MPYKKKGSKVFLTRVTPRHGPSVIKSTGFTTKMQANAAAVVLDKLRRGELAHHADLLDEIAAGRLTIREVMEHQQDLDGLKARLATGGAAAVPAADPAAPASAPTVSEAVTLFLPLLVAVVRSAKSKQRIARALALFTAFRPAPDAPTLGSRPIDSLTTADLQAFAIYLETARRVTASGETKPKWSGATRHAVLTYVKAFLDHCCDARLLAKHPMRGQSAHKKQVPMPKPDAPRTLFLEDHEALTLVRWLPNLEQQAYAAILVGTAADAGAALLLRRRDLTQAAPGAPIAVRVPGTKTATRARTVELAAFMRPFVERYLAAHPGLDRLFPNITTTAVARNAHKAALAAAIQAGRLSDALADYQQKDHRHTFAVRLVRAGMPPHDVGKLMGHKDGTMVLEVYGIYTPNQKSHQHFDAIASGGAVIGQVPAVTLALPTGPAPMLEGVATMDVADEDDAPVPLSHSRSKTIWPSDAELLRKAATMPNTRIAAQLGVSETAVRKRLNRIQSTGGNAARG